MGPEQQQGIPEPTGQQHGVLFTQWPHRRGAATQPPLPTQPPYAWRVRFAGRFGVGKLNIRSTGGLAPAGSRAPYFQPPVKGLFGKKAVRFYVATKAGCCCVRGCTVMFANHVGFISTLGYTLGTSDRAPFCILAPRFSFWGK